MSEVWAVNGEWVTQHKPQFGPGVKERYQQASATTLEQACLCQQHRESCLKDLTVRHR